MEYTVIFACAPQYILASMKFCSQYKVHIYIQIASKCTRQHYDYIKPILQKLPFVLSVDFYTPKMRVKLKKTKWNEPVQMWRNFITDHIIDATHLQDPRWQGLHRIHGDPKDWLFQAYLTKA